MSQKFSLAIPKLTLLTMSASTHSSSLGLPPSAPRAAAHMAAGRLVVPAPKRSVNFAHLEASTSKDFNFFNHCFSAPRGCFFLLSIFKLRKWQFRKRSLRLLTNITTGSAAARPARPSRSCPGPTLVCVVIDSTVRALWACQSMIDWHWQTIDQL